MSRSKCSRDLQWFAAMLASMGLAYAAVSYASPQIETPGALSKIYRQAVASPTRTDDDRRADANRKPFEFLQFSGLRPGMRVLDVAAGGGYTTQLLALAVGSKGTVWAQGPEIGQAMQKRLSVHPQANIVPVARPFEDPVPDNAPKLDLITLIMNYHDITYMPVDREKMNRHLFDALKRGGHLVILDHSAKPGSGISVAKTLHRIEEKVVLDEERKAGFQLDKEGYFMKNPADPRDQAFFNMTIPTDKFALRFVKP
ncbi:MAG: class I SAM-dependent methyltransferase [Gallionella sp.]